tara:strand:- start:385 stop:621 length:237 start_codon:yes stop_codon:yes gene_type:complete
MTKIEKLTDVVSYHIKEIEFDPKKGLVMILSHLASNDIRFTVTPTGNLIMSNLTVTYQPTMDMLLENIKPDSNSEAIT